MSFPQRHGESALDDGARKPVRLDPGEAGDALRQRLLELAYDRSLDTSNLNAGLAEMALTHGLAVYAQMLHLLSRVRFSVESGRSHWKSLIEHRLSMERRMGSAVDLHVALVSYLVQVQQELKRPIVLELELFEQTQASVYRDALTGLYNYRAFKHHLAQEAARADRAGTPLSLIVADVDDFKLHNESRGHEGANETLVSVSRWLAEHARSTDLACRYGGEEFAWLLPMTSKIEACALAEKLRTAVADGGMGDRTCVTLSLGVATYPGDAGSADELVACADRAMYEAKASGKNRTQSFGGSTRSYQRRKTTLDGRLRRLEEAPRAVTILSVGDGGLLFCSDCDPPECSLVELELDLPGATEGIRVVGRVVHTRRPEAGTNETAIRLVEVAEEDRARLTAYVRGLEPATTD